MKLLNWVSLPGIFALVLNTSAQATVVAQYGFDGNSFSSQVSVTGVDPQNITNGAGVPLTLNGTQGNPGPTLEFGFGTVGSNLTNSVAGDDYYSFTIAPVNSEITFNRFDFDFFKTANAGANVQAILFSDLDGFAVGDELGLGQLTGTGDSGSFQSRSISLASLPANIDAPVEFRLYVHNSGASNPNNVFRLDNLSLDASVTLVPEPSTGLLALLSLGLVARRRRG